MYYIYTAVLTVGFDRGVYTVTESVGEVILNVNILSGDLSNDLVVRVDTRQRTAEGNNTLCY